MTELVTPASVEKRITDIDERIESLLEHHEQASEALALADAAYKRAYLAAHITSLNQFPKRRVGEHQTIAEQAAMDEYEALMLAKANERTIRESLHSLRQILSSYQSLNGNVRDAAALNRYGRGR